MIERAIAIGLKIPDNEAFTALAALQRLGVAAERLERNAIWRVEDGGDAATLRERIEANEMLFNPNKHRLVVLESLSPRAGEAWIGAIGQHDAVQEHLGGRGIPEITRGRRYVGWRLLGADGAPVAREIVAAAVERLLCNPAIDEAYF